MVLLKSFDRMFKDTSPLKTFHKYCPTPYLKLMPNIAIVQYL